MKEWLPRGIIHGTHYKKGATDEGKLKGISSIVEANELLKEYLPIYNRRFAKKAAQAENLHRPIAKGLDLHRILCIKTERTVLNDCAIAHDKKLY